MYFLYWYDYILAPLYLIGISLYLRNYFLKRHGFNVILKEHFTRGAVLKFVGCIAIALIYEFYYNGAYDGRFYFEGGKMLSSYWKEHPSAFLPTLFQDIKTFNANNTRGLTAAQVNIFADESFHMAKIIGVFNLISFDAFLPCSLLLCTTAFVAIWNLFIFFIREYGLTAKIAALCSLYIPSVLIWDSSIFKDTVTFTCLCWAFISGYYLFIKPRKIFANALGLLTALFLIFTVKIYIIACFVPFFVFYCINSYKMRIGNKFVRSAIGPLLTVVSIGAIGLILLNAGELLGRYSIDKVLETSTKTAIAIASSSDAGSSYDMKVDYTTISGLLIAIPLGINVTLFRPYPWEYLKPFTLLASIESMIILYFTISIIFKAGLRKTLKLIINYPILQFCLLFSLLFAFMVGVSSSNFGSLVRYKIPCLPFYCLFLALVYTTALKKENKPQIKTIRQIA